MIDAHIPQYGAPAGAYPAFKYHPDGRAVQVESPLEEAELGDGWFNTPDPAKQAAYLAWVATRERPEGAAPPDTASVPAAGDWPCDARTTAVSAESPPTPAPSRRSHHKRRPDDGDEGA
jgi:hypothetical protein